MLKTLNMANLPGIKVQQVVVQPLSTCSPIGSCLATSLHGGRAAAMRPECNGSA